MVHVRGSKAYLNLSFGRLCHTLNRLLHKDARKRIFQCKRDNVDLEDFELNDFKEFLLLANEIACLLYYVCLPFDVFLVDGFKVGSFR